ncbi:MAG TPA: Hsp20/alpha crystallin family protein [Vicinamibacteria bacterium]|jgi:HSP20 family protein
MAQYSLYQPWGAEASSPFDQLRREMDALLNRFGGASASPSEWQGVFPAVNLYETSDAYMLTAELPGVEPDDIEVSIQGSTVTLSGERRIDYAGQKEVSLHRRERQDGSFRRAFQLPVAIDGDKIEAVHRNGVLMLRLPKSPESQPRQIAVQAG